MHKLVPVVLVCLVTLSRDLQAQTNSVRDVVVAGNKPSPSCSQAELTGYSNNATEIAEKLNGITEGVTVRALGQKLLLICGDDTNAAVRTLREAALKMGEEKRSSPAARESPVVRLFFNRDATGIVAILAKAFPKLGAYAAGTDTIVLGAGDGSDAATARNAKRWIAALDLPRAQIDLSIWSAQVSGKDRDEVGRAATRIKTTVAQHNRELEHALQRAHAYLVNQQLSDHSFLAPRFANYLRRRYVVAQLPAGAAPEVNLSKNQCKSGAYCLGYEQIFDPHPNLSSILINILAAANPKATATAVVNELEGAPGRDMQREGYSATQALQSTYKVEPNLARQRQEGLHSEEAGCEIIAEAAYQDTHSKPVFPCLREALNDATQDHQIARLRVSIADFLIHYKFMQHYPDASAPANDVIHHMDSLAAPLLTAFHRDMAAYLRHVRDRVVKEKIKGVQYSNDGIVSLATTSSIASSVSTVTQSEFRLPPSFSLKDFLAAASPAKEDSIPKFLGANLTAGVALPLLAGLSMETPPAIASLGRGLTISVTPQTLPGASGSAELNINVTSQDEPAPTVKRGSTSEPDTRSRVAKHNLQTVVRVKSLRLFELSGFAAELRRGGDSIPIIPPYVELPVIGSLLRWPVKPGQVHHRSFAIASAVVMPTSADLASTVIPSRDVKVTLVSLRAKAENPGPVATCQSWIYKVTGRRQSGDSVVSDEVKVCERPNVADNPVKLSWNPLGDDVVYDVYRMKGATPELLESNLAVIHLDDTGKAGVSSKMPEKTTVTSFAVISPISFLAGNVTEYHRLMRACIAKEADRRLPVAVSCKKLSLSGVTGPR